MNFFFVFLILLSALCYAYQNSVNFYQLSMSEKHYPPQSRIRALKNLKFLISANNGKFKKGMFSESMSTCFVIKDENRAYLLRRWIKPFMNIQKFGNITTPYQITTDFFDTIITEYTKLISGKKIKYHIIHNPANRLCDINAYVKPILSSYLKFQDDSGFVLNARGKLAAYKQIIADPEYFQQFGAPQTSPFKLTDIPKSIIDYNRSTFLANVYPTTLKPCNSTKLTPEVGTYRVIFQKLFLLS